MASQCILNGTEISYDQFSTLNRLTFDNIDICLEGILAQDSQDERCILVGKAIPGPFGVFRKIEKVECFVLIRCVGTGLRMKAAEREGKYR